MYAYQLDIFFTLYFKYKFVLTAHIFSRLITDMFEREVPILHRVFQISTMSYKINKISSWQTTRQ